MEKKLVSFMLIAVLVVAFVTGCSSSSSEALKTVEKKEEVKDKVNEEAKDEVKEDSKEETKTIAVVPWDMSQAFAAAFAQTAQKEIEARGWKAVVMDPAGDWSTEYTILQDLITQGVDGIIYTAIDTEGANDAVAEVQAAGIPIVDYDCLASKGVADASVAYDDYQGGLLAAQSCMEALNGKEDATVVVFEEEPSIASSGKRIKGFSDYITNKFPNVTIIKNRTFDRTSSGCYSWATDMITAYPEADAFFCYWSDCAMATYNALQDSGATDVYVIGYDATAEQQELMKSIGEDCKLYASPGMSAVKMASQCVMFLEDIYAGTYARSGSDDIFMLTPPLLTVKNANDFNVDE